jgi:hypothetical protein
MIKKSLTKKARKITIIWEISTEVAIEIEVMEVVDLENLEVTVVGLEEEVAADSEEEEISLTEIEKCLT